MADSTIVFEEGESIDVGSHGEHDFVYHEGEPVTDTGISSLVFEGGTGLGGGGALVMQYGDDTENFGGAGKIDQGLTEVLGTDSESTFEKDSDLEQALNQSVYGLVVVVCAENSRRLKSNEMSALSDWWSSEAEEGLLVLTENQQDNGPRAALGNDCIEACIGARPYDEGTKTSDWYNRPDDYGGSGSSSGCYDPAVPTGYNPPLEGISATTAFETEATTHSPDDDRGTFYSYDPSEGPRLYGDGSYTRFGDVWDCADNQQYVTQCIEWLARER